MIFIKVLQPQLRKWILILALVGAGSSASAKIQFFDDKNFQGLFHEIDSSSISACTEFPNFGVKLLSSIKPFGECIILFDNKNCNKGLSLRIAPDNENHHSDLDLLEFDNKAEAFRLCDEDEGGPKIHVELFDEPKLQGNLVFEFSDLCHCLNLPKSTLNASSLENHGNCVKIFKEEACQGNSRILEGGHSKYSEDFSEAGFDRVTKSIGLCSDEIRPSCMKMTATIFKFEVNNPGIGIHSKLVGDIPLSSQKVELAPPTIFSNKASSSSVIHQYSAESTITESVKVDIIQSLVKQAEVVVEENLHVESNISSIGLFGKGKIDKILKSAYEGIQSQLKVEQGKIFIHEEELKVVANQQINVSPCSQYRVTSGVKVIHDHPMNYNIYVKLAGLFGGIPLSAEQIRDNLNRVHDGDLEFIEILDEHTISAKAQGIMTATFGYETVVDGEESKVEGCEREYASGHGNVGDGQEVWIYRESKYELYMILFLSMITTGGVTLIVFRMMAENRRSNHPSPYHASVIESQLGKGNITFPTHIAGGSIPPIRS